MKINADIVLGGPNLKMLWIDGRLVLGPAARLGFSSRILNLGWRVNTYCSDICKLLSSMKYLQSIYIMPETVNQWQTSLTLCPNNVKFRTAFAMRLHESAYSTYTLPTTSTQPKPLIDANNRYHSYIPSEINDLREMFLVRRISLNNDEELVTIDLKLANGPLLTIHCNPSHRVMDLYGHVRQETAEHFGFDLVKVPYMILDVKTFKKTVGELHLQDSSIVQVLRNFDSVEYQLKLCTVFHSLSDHQRPTLNLSRNIAVTDETKRLGKRKNDDYAATKTKRAKYNESVIQSSEVNNLR